ncbi:MAG: hypothetical protein QW728_06680 [Thermoplasmata archaeon]
MNRREQTHSLSEDKEVVVLSEEEIESHVISILREKGSPMTTSEIERASLKNNKRCPEGTIAALAMLRAKGVIIGRISRIRKCWIWYLPGMEDEVKEL